MKTAKRGFGRQTTGYHILLFLTESNIYELVLVDGFVSDYPLYFSDFFLLLFVRLHLGKDYITWQTHLQFALVPAATEIRQIFLFDYSSSSGTSSIQWITNNIHVIEHFYQRKSFFAAVEC